MNSKKDYTKTKLSIFYGPAGGGHYIVSKALKEESESRGIETELIDITEFGKQGFKNPSKSYSFFIKYLRFLHMLINYAMKIQVVGDFFNRIIWWQVKEKLIPFMKELSSQNMENSWIIVNTYPQYTYILNEAKQRLGIQIPIVTIVTDISFIYSLWFDKRTNLTILPTVEAYKNGYMYFKKYKDKVEKFGIPIRKKFFEAIKRERSKVKTKKDRRNILILSGAEGMGNVGNLIKDFDQKCKDIKIQVSIGKNTNLKNTINGIKYNNEIEIIEWTEEFEKYIKAADVIITKGGSISLWECMCTGNQIIIFDYIEGQETGNKELVKIYTNGIYETNFEKIAELVSEDNFNPKIPDFVKVNWSEKIISRILELL